MKKAVKYAGLFIAVYLISAAVIAVLELIRTSTIDIEKVFTFSIGPTIGYSIANFLRLKKEAAKDTKTK